MTKKIYFKDINDGKYEEWQLVELSDIVNIYGTGTSDIQVNYKTDYPVTRIETIAGRKVNINKVGYVKDKPKEELILQKNDILFSNINSIEHIGKTALITEEDLPLYHGMNLLKISAKENSNSVFIYHFLNSPMMKKKYITLANKAVSQASINQTVLKTIKIRVPSLPEQIKIANLFSALDTRIELQDKKLNLLVEQKKGYSQKIFSRELVFKDDNGNSYGEWENLTLSDVINTGKSGGTPSSTNKEYYNGDIPFLGIADISKQGKFISTTEKSITQIGLDSSSAWIVPANSLIYAMYASVGKVAFNSCPMATSQALFAMQPNTEIINSEYLYQYLYFFQKNGLSAFITKGTQGNINASTLKGFNIPTPSLSEQEKIANFLSTLDENIDLEKQKLELLKQQKQGYMQRIFA
jgi:type I restriction enzyme S subunit